MLYLVGRVTAGARNNEWMVGAEGWPKQRNTDTVET